MESSERRPLKYVVTAGWLIPEKGWVPGLGIFLFFFKECPAPSVLFTNCFPGSHRYSQTTTDFDGQRWLSFDSLTHSTPYTLC
jgi:hypothetical protein